MEEDLRMSNLNSRQLCEGVSQAYVMVRYGFSPCIIRCTTLLHPKQVTKVKDHYVLHGGTYEYRKTGKKSTPNSILKDPETYYAYNQLMTLYIRFHSSDPSDTMDLEALLQAWCVYLSHLTRENEEPEDLDINSFWQLCHYLSALCVRSDDVDSGIVLFSRDDSAFYYHSTRSSKPVGESGYESLKSLPEVIRELKKRTVRAS